MDEAKKKRAIYDDDQSSLKDDVKQARQNQLM